MRRCFSTLSLIVIALLMPVDVLAQRDSTTSSDSTAVAVRKIGDVRLRFVRAMRQGDSTLLGTTIAEHFVLGRNGLKPPDGQRATIVGRDAFVAEWQNSIFSQVTGINPWVQYPAETSVHGDWGFEVGEYGPDSGPSSGKRVGRYVWVLRRGPTGEWKIAYMAFGGSIR